MDGWGTVGEIKEDDSWSIRVEFDNGNNEAFNKEGKIYEENAFPTLFWDEVHITPPPRPKRMVKKEGWVPEGWIEEIKSNRFQREFPNDGDVVKVTYEVEE
jgi:hypothetical protein